MDFLVSDQIDEILIGIDWMRAHRCQLLLDSLTIALHGHRFPLLEKYTVNRCHRLVLQQEVEIPGSSEMLVNGRVVYSSLKRKIPAVWMADTVECVPGVRTASMVVSSQEGMNLPVRLVNTTKETVQLPEGMKLGALHDILSISKNGSNKPAIPESRKPATAEKQIEKILSEVHPEVSMNQKEQLESLLMRYSDILSVDEYDMGLTDLTQQDIDTGTERPVRQALRKTPMAYNQIIDQHIQSMLQQGLIEPSKEEWASNIVLVQKKDKTFRFCLDYRALNQKSIKEIFPIPRIDASLDALAGSAWVLDFGFALRVLSGPVESLKCAQDFFHFQSRML